MTKYVSAILMVLLIGGEAHANTANECGITGGNLAEAKALYAESCPNIPRADCDPVAGSSDWYCSSEQVGVNAPGIGGNSTTTSTTAANGTTTTVPLPDPAPVPVLPESSTSECYATGANLADAIEAYDASCLAPRVDCDPLGGAWSCSSGVIGQGAPNANSVSTQTSSTPQTTSVYTGPIPKESWADSYAYNGVCYMQTNGDHGVWEKTTRTPTGQLVTVRQVANLIETGPGQQFADALYNDVQCGNGPANSAYDEVECPARVDQGRAGCHRTGPKWKFK